MRHTDAAARAAAWVAVIDAETECTYYWDRVSGRTQWAPVPRAAEFAAAGAFLPFVLADAGTQRAPLPDGSVRVQHAVTFERCTKDGQRSSDWYIVAL
jgi:hypothetical protein